MELRGSEAVPVKSRVDEPLHQAERRACDERCAEWARDTTFEPGSATLASSVELSGQVVTRFQRDVPEERATHERRERVRQS